MLLAVQSPGENLSQILSYSKCISPSQQKREYTVLWSNEGKINFSCLGIPARPIFGQIKVVLTIVSGVFVEYE